jgi:hypothetical protein
MKRSVRRRLAPFVSPLVTPEFAVVGVAVDNAKLVRERSDDGLSMKHFGAVAVYELKPRIRPSKLENATIASAVRAIFVVRIQSSYLFAVVKLIR